MSQASGSGAAVPEASELELASSKLNKEEARVVAEGLSLVGADINSFYDLELYTDLPKAWMQGLAIENKSGTSSSFQLTSAGKAFVEKWI
jgi:hypothetical protein